MSSNLIDRTSGAIHMSSNLIDRTMDWGIAKLVKASDSESDMRRFESYYPCQLPGRLR